MNTCCSVPSSAIVSQTSSWWLRPLKTSRRPSVDRHRWKLMHSKALAPCEISTAALPKNVGVLAMEGQRSFSAQSAGTTPWTVLDTSYAQSSRESPKGGWKGGRKGDGKGARKGGKHKGGKVGTQEKGKWKGKKGKRLNELRELAEEP